MRTRAHTRETIDIAQATAPRNARQEAQDLVGPDYVARVIEPSPPAVIDEWFADDPVAVPEHLIAPALSPVSNAGTTWDEWASTRAELASWVRARWLGAYGAIGLPPAGFTETRDALHRLAVYALSPARRRANGKIGLRYALGGFGTPFFGDDEQVRVVSGVLVHQIGETAHAEPITTIRRAAALVLDDEPDVGWAQQFDVPALGNPDEQLRVDAAAAAYLADWYGFAFSVLEEFRADAESTDGDRVQLWPEHFDVGFECLGDEKKQRATFGASPGDATHPQPYLYVTPWRPDNIGAGDAWNATGFRGALLPLDELAAGHDQRGTALAFYRTRRELLTG